MKLLHHCLLTSNAKFSAKTVHVCLSYTFFFFCQCPAKYMKKFVLKLDIGTYLPAVNIPLIKWGLNKLLMNKKGLKYLISAIDTCIYVGMVSNGLQMVRWVLTIGKPNNSSLLKKGDLERPSLLLNTYAAYFFRMYDEPFPICTVSLHLIASNIFPHIVYEENLPFFIIVQGN